MGMKKLFRSLLIAGLMAGIGLLPETAREWREGPAVSDSVSVVDR